MYLTCVTRTREEALQCFIIVNSAFWWPTAAPTGVNHSSQDPHAANVGLDRMVATFRK